MASFNQVTRDHAKGESPRLLGRSCMPSPCLRSLIRAIEKS